MARHHLYCPHCSAFLRDVTLTPWPEQVLHACCNTPLEIAWTNWRATTAAWHPADTIAVWQDPQTGQVAYPPRNDIPLPRRYAERGYERREIRSLHDLQRFEKEQGVRNQAAWFDKGSGRGFEDGNKFGV